MVATLEFINHAQIDLLTSEPMFLAKLASAQSVASVTSATPIASVPKVSWPTPDLDSYNGWSSLDPTKYTPQISGYYLVIGQVAFAQNATGSRILNISKNGGAGTQTIGQVVGAPASDNNYDNVVNCSGVDFFNGMTDFVQLAVYQGTGSNLNLNAPQTKISILRIHV